MDYLITARILRQTLEELIDAVKVGEHANTCHCKICMGELVLSSTGALVKPESE